MIRKRLATVWTAWTRLGGKRLCGWLGTLVLAGCGSGPIRTEGSPLPLAPRDSGPAWIFTGEGEASSRPEAVALATSAARAQALETTKVRIRSEVRMWDRSSRDAEGTAENEASFEVRIASLATGALQKSRLVGEPYVEYHGDGRVRAMVQVWVPKSGTVEDLARNLALRLEGKPVSRIVVHELCAPFEGKLIRSTYGVEAARRLGNELANRGYLMLDLDPEEKVDAEALAEALVRHQADALLDGTYLLGDDLSSVEIRARIRRPGAEVLASASDSIPVTARERQLLQRVGFAQELAGQVLDIQDFRTNSELFHLAPTDPLADVEVWTSAPTYRVGDEIEIFVKASRAGHVVLACIDTSGDLTLFAPSVELGAISIERNQVLRFPSPEASSRGWKIRATPPAGLDRLKVLVSDRPWEEGWQGSSPSELLEGLRRSLEGARFGEARCEVEVLESEAP